MSTNPNILVIDDEIQIRRLLRLNLQSNNYNIIEAENGTMGLELAASHHPDLIILDLGLPDKDGLDVLKDLRHWSNIPVIILSVRNSENDIVTALDSGANDYLAKPFNSNELLARIRASLRQQFHELSSPIFISGNVEVDLNLRTVKRFGEIIKLTATEYALLTLFIKNAGKVITHSFILKEIWGLPFSEETQYVRIYIAQLRKKLEDDPYHPVLFTTESGIGYRLNVVLQN
jgi:two-component system, OmpR family, KDP operon response regulator KdpE